MTNIAELVPGPSKDSIITPKAPPGQAPVSSGETPPKRRGRPPGSTNKSRASTASLKSQISGLLVTLNLALMLVPFTSRDAMDEVEIDALATALDAQAKGSPRFRAMLTNALAVSSGGQLLGVCAIIGARRAARHGLIPVEMDMQLGLMLNAVSASPPQPPVVTLAREEQPRDGSAV